MSNSGEVKLPYEVVDGAVVLGSKNELTALMGLLRRMRKEEGMDGRCTSIRTSSGVLAIPEAIDGLPVKGIGYWAFHGCNGLV